MVEIIYKTTLGLIINVSIHIEKQKFLNFKEASSEVKEKI